MDITLYIYQIGIVATSLWCCGYLLKRFVFRRGNKCFIPFVLMGLGIIMFAALPCFTGISIQSVLFGSVTSYFCAGVHNTVKGISRYLKIRKQFKHKSITISNSKFNFKNHRI